MIKGFDIKTIDDEEINNKRIVLRSDFDVPLESDGSIADDTRIRDSLDTIRYLLQKNNRLVIISKLNRPKTRDSKHSLKPVARRLQEFFQNYEVVFVDDFVKNDYEIVNQTPNQIILLENIRFYPEEEKNDFEFVKKIASFGSVFVMDAFAMLHRDEASVVGVAKILPSYAGLQLKREIETISKVLNAPDKPYVAILGGAKISTKIGLISKLLSIADDVLLGGALANTFFAAQNIRIGKSLYDAESVDMAKQILNEMGQKKGKLHLPLDVIVENSVAVDIHAVPDDKSILDIGPQTIAAFAEIISRAKTIVWNGPLGYTENEHYRVGTSGIFQAITQKEDVFSLIGGGDTIAAIADEPNRDKISHISTGGGAMLEFIEKGTLPGIEALRMKRET